MAMEDLQRSLDFGDLSLEGAESRIRQLFEQGTLDIFTYRELTSSLAQTRQQQGGAVPDSLLPGSRDVLAAGAAGAAVGSLLGPVGTALGGLIGSFFGRRPSARTLRQRRNRRLRAQFLEGAEELARGSATQENLTFISRHRASERLRLARESVHRRRF